MIDVHIRWLIRRDRPEVQEIENWSFEFPWTEEDFARVLGQRIVIGMVAEHEDRVAGYMVYELHRTHIRCLNFAVSPIFRRLSVGSQMSQQLKSKLSRDRRSRIVLEVRETNLGAQLFFRSQGFRAVTVLRDFYEETEEDAYIMEYRHRRSDSALPSRHQLGTV